MLRFQLRRARLKFYCVAKYIHHYVGGCEVIGPSPKGKTNMFVLSKHVVAGGDFRAAHGAWGMGHGGQRNTPSGIEHFFDEILFLSLAEAQSAQSLNAEFPPFLRVLRD